MTSLAVVSAVLDGEAVGLRTRTGAIAELGPDVAAAAGDEVIDAAGMALVPGFVNGHTHAAMTLFRGYADDLPLMEWLEGHIWPAEARLEAEDVYWGARLACAEMIRTGTVRFWDMYWQPGATARAVADAGLRATIGAPLIDGTGGGLEGLKRAAEEGLDELDDAPADGRPRRSHRTRSTRSRPSRCEWIGERSRAERPAVQIHVSETESEVHDCLEAHGVRPGRAPRSVRRARPAHAARAFGLARRRRARADRRARVHDRHQPGREHEARGRRSLRPARGARTRDPGRPRHRRGRLQQLARPARRRQAPRAAAEARGRRRRGGARRGGARDRRRPAGRRSSGRASSPRASRPTSCSSAPIAPSSGSARWPPASSTRPRARSWTRRWSPDGF